MAENDIDRDAIKDEVDQIFGNRPKHEGPELYQVNDQSSIKHVIGVISGKGGVGKSLVTGILATELARKGHKVGILDADITGPSIPKMFGLSGLHVFGQGDKIIPAQSKGGIKIMSTNLVLENENDPVLWRGPMLMGALKQFYEDTLWGDIDYLLVDMPPGTGDVALTVFQSLPIEGVVIVSSPQDLVQVIVGKAVKMAAMMNVPVLGVVENMSYMECPECGHKLEPFGPSHLQEIVDEFKVADLGRIPIDPKVAASCDAGTFESELPEGLIPKAVSAVEA
ncbi:Mrp/NBP35 family ATP-binding protein [Parafannyhessea umbonata]|jgi:Mrp family chromosome partitioning ATPase|uniref:Iron-sulfur cluster carrier protein n=2 Tax=Parafannyhessea umbonata TaxID=604330 RepID=A0A6N7X6U9_9ACTN|nr:Mrp/NBP35 family ATP-binding protein [Parafannyhessea umbonata]MDD6359462.1 Mrp/NBP35 family ATP-binding protein [Parafannyhessea umbonata]MDD7199274.1 Mrp/NBP35 family ATP-binding protein [Parafannyhessea umbonata]MDY4014913.1 Mrp/NBP35 family ATP-binding protein [Parafannyhessea umbonata]MDY4419119.1 Mrp/NBP35 family ATP-binding protein [Parafannyhessea umbonata]MST60306.1 Mrp/NBP35 family ATP-binding protein [Parafannyhessea umbonata]